MTTTRRRKFRLKTEVIIKARIQKGLSQRDLATALGLPVENPVVSRIERGDPVHPKWVPMLAAALGLEPDQFVEYL